MKIITIMSQIKNNLVAIISLIIAITALSYNTWRNERTEKNRNTRTAAFEILKELGELQIIINYSHYLHDKAMGNPFLGWGHIAFINDLGQLLPNPVPAHIKTLTEVWGKNWEKIPSNEAATDSISNEIDQSRESVLDALRQLK
jgi:hypothetical protein